MEKASEWLEKHKNQTKLLVLDDFERSAMNPTELMGIINNYVENEGYKVILLADESKLEFSDNKQADLALQYDVVLNHQGKIELADSTKAEATARVKALLSKHVLYPELDLAFLNTASASFTFGSA